MLSTTHQRTPDQQHHAAPLPPSHPKFRSLDSVLLQIEAQRRGPRRTLLKLRKRWIERAVPSFVPQQRTEAR